MKSLHTRKQSRARALKSILMIGVVLAIASFVLLQKGIGLRSTSAATTELFFSEYIEGSSTNKALEIYNGTNAPVDLAAGGYIVEFYFNGATTAGLTINLAGTVGSNGVFVVAPTNATDPTILARANQTFGTSWFNGDDAVVLKKGATIIDVIGVVGTDPGTEWGSGLASTADNTIRRKSIICAGEVDPANAFDPSAEWDGLAQDTFAGLGGHFADCASPNQPVVPVCPASVAAIAGTAGSGTASASDADGIVSSALITSITPSNPGTISLSNFVAASAAGGTATVTLNVGAGTPVGNYTVTITWSNNNDTPQTATCNIAAQVIPSGTVLIHDIQGTAETPNFAGLALQIRGIVVGDFQGSTGLNGFFVEEEQSDWDANPNTSEGIFIFAPSAPNVNVGDDVTVTGTVANFPTANGVTQLSTVTSVVVNSTGNPLPPAQAVTLPVPTSAAADLEKYEGMRVSFGALTVTDNSSLGSFGELVLAPSRLFIPTNSIDPNDNPATGNSISGNSNVSAINAQQSLNNRSRIVLNDGRSGSNLNPIAFIGAGTNSTIRLGDTVSGLGGVLNFGFGTYRVEPTGTVSFAAANPRTTAPDAVGGTLKVASFNLENFFFTLGSRGATNQAERDRQRDKLAAALAALNADVVGLIELEKGTQANPDAAVNELIAKLNTLGVGTYAVVPTPAAVYAATNPVGTDTDIKSGMIYRTSTVMTVGASLTDTAAAAGTYSRAPIAQTFQSKANGSRFSVVVNHFRSKICASGTTGEDNDQSTGQACFNARRRIQAQAVVSFINNTLAPIDPDVINVGDFNAYAQEDPIDVFRAAGFVDVLASAPGQSTLVFSGESGRIDHAFVTPSFASQVTGGTIWNINAEEPDVFDYNTENKPDDRYAPTPYRSADHNPILLGLNLSCPSVAIAPDSLPGGTAGTPYNQTLTASGGLTPYTFSVSGGIFPDGLSLSPAGVISGTPTKTGTFSFTVTVNAGAGCAGIRNYSISISCPTIGVTPATIQSAFRGQSHSVTFVAAGGVGPYTYAYSGPRPPGMNFNAETGVFSGTPTASGNYAFRITVTDANGCSGFVDYPFAVHAIATKLTEPSICTGPGSVVTVEATISNGSTVAQQGSFSAALPAGLRAVNGACTGGNGSCSIVNASTVMWSGTLNGSQSTVIRFLAQVVDNAQAGVQFCVSTFATIGNSVQGTATPVCTSVTCPASAPGLALPAASPASDNRPGSVLIFNLYTSSADGVRQNTRVNLTNTDASRAVTLHLFFVDGSTCQVADNFLCLTANQTASFLASDLDPATTGYLVAVAVDQNGCPISFNSLIGDAYVKFASGHAANLAAQSVSAIAGGLPLCDVNATTATLAFDGVSYSPLPHVLAADSVPSRADGNDTMLVLNRISGNLATGAGTIGNVFGILYDDGETPLSFSLASGACQLRGSISANFPRTTPRFDQFIPAGRSGYMKFWISGGTAAMTGATINFNANAGGSSSAYSQGHNLHALTVTTSASITIPVFTPGC